MNLIEEMYEKALMELNELKKHEEGYYYSFIMDEEGDLFCVEFHNDNSVKIFSDTNFLTLSSQNLYVINELLELSNKLYNEL